MAPGTETNHVSMMSSDEEIGGKNVENQPLYAILILDLQIHIYLCLVKIQR